MDHRHLIVTDSLTTFRVQRTVPPDLQAADDEDDQRRGRGLQRRHTETRTCSLRQNTAFEVCSQVGEVSVVKFSPERNKVVLVCS